jgi:hypothetical protein
MKTKKTIEYKAAPYGHIATIPTGTPVVEATNLPDGRQYWVEPWPEMEDASACWQRTYGFLVNWEDVEEL